ncbi:MAG: hypothetical protein ABJB22_06370 [Verrucomicrobiota bacterium]
MIGVATSEKHRPAAAEFFELFKTAWEFYQCGSAYEVLLCCDASEIDARAKLVLIYGPAEQPFDRKHRLETVSDRSPALVTYRGDDLPIFGECARFIGNDKGWLDQKSGQPIMARVKCEDQFFIRIGFDLFEEVRNLLCSGQPSQFAQSPSIELHIAILRDLLIEHLIPFVEIPPVPNGYNFIACLTHDVDHFGIRNHRFDHTTFGFLYRATVGSLLDVCRGRKSTSQLLRNWIAAFSLPLVHLGLVPDFWTKLERYLEIEGSSPSTFYIIPQKDEAGIAADGTKPRLRAARYDAAQLSASIDRIRHNGGEVGVHGIDAWRDSTAARRELAQIHQLIETREVGIRMHWLFFDLESPAKLERAGFSYDSTIGYNETIGYRCGTSQAFKPFGTERLLELPLHVMDTALFYPSYLNLSTEQAMARINVLVENASRFGGALTINWHDRSIAPERLWDLSYSRIVETLRSKGPWFATASDAVAWFRKRRSAVFERVASEGYNSDVRIVMQENDDGLPELRIRSYRSTPSDSPASFAQESYSEVRLGESELAIVSP